MPIPRGVYLLCYTGRRCWCWLVSLMSSLRNGVVSCTSDAASGSSFSRLVKSSGDDELRKVFLCCRLALGGHSMVGLASTSYPGRLKILAKKLCVRSTRT